MKYLYLVVISFIFLELSAQDPRIFKDTKIINSVSIETLEKRKLDFRIGHKFGDFGGSSGGWATFYGLENAADVLIGFDYGLTDKVMIGISRTKGSDILRQNINLSTKLKIGSDNKEGSAAPFSLAVYGLASVSTIPKSTSNELTLTSFPKAAHRAVYHLQVMAGTKIANKLSLQANAGLTYRNIVREGDRNDLVSIGGAAKYQFNKSFAIIGEAIFPFNGSRAVEGIDYFPISGIAIEWETGGGHTFQMNFTNAEGIIATDYIPNTTESWSNGEYRLGFIISRLFTI